MSDIDPLEVLENVSSEMKEALGPYHDMSGYTPRIDAAIIAWKKDREEWEKRFPMRHPSKAEGDGKWIRCRCGAREWECMKCKEQVLIGDPGPSKAERDVLLTAIRHEQVGTFSTESDLKKAVRALLDERGKGKRVSKL